MSITSTALASHCLTLSSTSEPTQDPLIEDEVIAALDDWKEQELPLCQDRAGVREVRSYIRANFTKKHPRFSLRNPPYIHITTFPSIVERFTWIRVLNLSYTHLKLFSISDGALPQLKELFFQFSEVHTVSLPESLLLHLQKLILSSTPALKNFSIVSCQIPSDSVYQLRCLEIDERFLDSLPSALQRCEKLALNICCGSWCVNSMDRDL